jgi:hypothetical protein
MFRQKGNASIRASKPITIYNSVFLISIVLLALCVTCASSRGQEGAPLRLVQTISLPNVKGRIDHMDVDTKGNRLFVAGLENGSLEVVDLKTGQWLRSIPGFRKPQGVVYVSSLNRLFLSKVTPITTNCSPTFHRALAFARATSSQNATAFMWGVPVKGNEPAQVWT